MYLSKGTYILKKTGNKPDFTKQPYFKRLLFELWLSEPDYKLGLDEEIISSLESIHDELYFDTLDFIRGITEIELEDESLAEDSSRYSAPGNILPLIHPSIEGQPGRVKVTLEDWQLKEQGVLETPFIFPCLKSLILSLKFEDLVKEEMFPVFPGEMDPGITPPENDPSTPTSRASRLSNRRKLTFVEETPELMDETARGPWLDFLVTQGLTYLFAHVEYLSQANYEIVRIEEEIQGRVSIQFVRARPGKIKTK